MQTTKTRNGNSEVPLRTSSTTTQAARQLKTPVLDSDDLPSPNPAGKTRKDRTPKVTERRSSPTQVSEKKRPTKVPLLESQIAQLQQELKKAKDQLNASESLKKRAQQEAEAASKQLAAMSAELEDSHQQLMEFSDSDDARLLELRKVSQDRDRAWQAELEAVRRHHSMDSAALASALNEIQKLKVQLDRVSESEAAQARRAESAHAEVENLQLELNETLSLVDRLKREVSDCRDSESQAAEVGGRTQMQIEMGETTEEALRSKGLKAMEAYRSVAMELEQSKQRVKSLENELAENASKNVDNKVLSEQLRPEVDKAKLEVAQLRSALDASERRYQEEYIKSTLQIRGAFELVEHAKSESRKRLAEVESKLKAAEAEIEVLRNSNSTEGEESKFEVDLADLRARLLDKETEVSSIMEENGMLRLEMEKREMERNEEAVASAEAVQASEQDTLVKVALLAEEADEKNTLAGRVTDQLDAALAENLELEAELRRVKVQADQWRKAAEAAAAMLSTGSNGKFTEKEGFFDGNNHTLGRALDCPFSEDLDDESLKKKHGNMLKKIGVLLKKGQK